ncbi:OsmC family protein [Aestuariibacter halophilus]|uniref:OsmC family protein n=1 Tax=Fluctibacter halophilus TaxID=226011 RepID=A0ABS8G440_9ALTE|nr:OsmC family protein [Aestuariibacter halophilus]MCC2615362.1 OsmC family protein [Aestuariibacter halophilus]
MKATVSWQQAMQFRGTTDTGHHIDMDGEGNAVSPMEAVLLAAGACSSIDVVEIMKKARQDIQACRCEMSAIRADDAPRVFKQIDAHYIVSGNDISEKHLARAVELSAEKYCSVMLMLRGNVTINTRYTIE